MQEQSFYKIDHEPLPSQEFTEQNEFNEESSPND
jgi:hypothetical protein